jgi:hypothetical protein
MKQAKYFISALNPNVKVSLSTLYNYTMNYKKGTHQAKAHHHGRGITANISLHKPPNTAEIKHPINAHWSTANVNYLVDLSAENPDSHLVDSKDAKCVVCGDIDPVLRPLIIHLISHRKMLLRQFPTFSWKQKLVNKLLQMMMFIVRYLALRVRYI